MKVLVKDKGDGEIVLTHHYKYNPNTRKLDTIYYYDETICQLCLEMETANCNNARCQDL